MFTKKIFMWRPAYLFSHEDTQCKLDWFLDKQHGIDGMDSIQGKIQILPTPKSYKLRLQLPGDYFY